MQIGLYELLPLFIRLKDAEASGSGSGDPLLKRVVGCVQAETDEIVALIDGLRELITISSTTEQILELLATYLGLGGKFSAVVESPREYVRDLAASHKIKGTLLSLVREQKARAVGTDTYIHELWKDEQQAVDEYHPNLSDTLYGSGMKAARVVFIEGVREEFPTESDGSVTGVFVEDQVPYSDAKHYRTALDHVFPIHVVIPPPTIRTAFEDEVDTPTDTLGGQIYALLEDQVSQQEDSIEILKLCVASCQVSCQERCEVLCELTCETTCENSCQAACEAECQATCQQFCEASCESDCQDACQGFCQSDCQATCQSACQINCQQNCQFGCENASESCTSFCETNCQIDAEVFCSETCQTFCQSDAQQPCEPGQPPAGEGG